MLFSNICSDFAGKGAYYLATAFDKIYMAPCGSVSLTGFLIDHPFVRGRATSNLVIIYEI